MLGLCAAVFPVPDRPGTGLVSRTERRDRRRVLGVLALYAVTAVGFSAVASAVPGSWAVTATSSRTRRPSTLPSGFQVGRVCRATPAGDGPAAGACTRWATVVTPVADPMRCETITLCARPGT